MSEVIRKAVVELELRLKKGGMQSGEVSAVTKEFEKQAAAVKNVETQTKAAYRAAQQYAKDVPQDWGKLFKSRADARNFAYQQHGELGLQYLKDDPTYIAALKRNELLIQEMEKTEEFGRKSNYAYIRGLQGMTEFGRGLALLAANGSKESEQLLKSIVAIQGGVDLVRGGLQMARLGPEFGAIAVAVAAAAGSWMLHAQQVERNKKLLEDLASTYDRASKAETKFFAERDMIAGNARTEQTEATQSPSALRAARARELAAIRSGRSEAGTVLANTRASRRGATLAAERLRSEASLYPESRWQDFLLYGPSEAFQNGGDRVAYHDRLMKEAQRQEGRARGYGQTEQTSLEQQLAMAGRERDILQKQRDDEIAQEQSRAAAQIANIHSMMSDPNQKAAIATATAQFTAQQFALSQQAEATGLVPSGFAYGRSFEQQQGWQVTSASQGNIEQIKRNFETGVKAMIDISAAFQTQLAKLKSDLAAAHSE